MPLLIWLLSFLLVKSEPLRRFELRGKAQGTTYSVIYYATDSIVTKGQCDSVFRSLDSALSIYQPYSEINRLNAAKRKFAAGPHLRNVLQKAAVVSRQTGGAFDVTVLPLVQAWGFGARPHNNPPDSATVRQLKSCTGWQLLRIRGRHVYKKKPCVQADVNGIAQGYSVDVLAGFLAAKGLENYLVEIGGELRVQGRRQPSGEPFTIGIESPEAAENMGAPLQQQLALRSGALTTSGSYRRYYLSGNKAIAHLLDPATGFPLTNNLVAVTVWAPDAITADAMDNALMTMGLERGLQFAEQQKDLEAYFIYKKRDGTPADTATSGFDALLQQKKIQ
ncbi:FAD:protein FMN transferase [Paracnuella aquatica]|uniref:FAD:protein FMN transferase n=1 Tax=Paracnuella aquatica TaxID=2268757 RepID=UPI000DEF5EA1|nr:FAD:protein FMN transferase [Paracnuella aquatica]RPD50567.1 FAD:protein FMN transferase [Paracnuella aquatica]